MRWQQGRRSENVDDRRGMRPAGMAVGGGLGTIVFIVIALLMGADPMALLQQVANNPQVAPQQQAGPISPEEEELKDFVSAVLGSTEDVWTEVFADMGKTYQKPTLVLFSGQVESACGLANSAVGPFYCPRDQQVYIDLSFYQELRDRFQAPGDFAQAYVLAHEVGHHVQNQLGIMDQVQRQRGSLSEEEYNALSVRLELQADFLAGLWAYHANKRQPILEAGDVEEAITAATAIGDDRLQREAQGYVVPDSFTHGTSEQRVRWFKRGLETGDISQGDTFNVQRL